MKFAKLLDSAGAAASALSRLRPAVARYEDAAKVSWSTESNPTKEAAYRVATATLIETLLAANGGRPGCVKLGDRFYGVAYAADLDHPGRDELRLFVLRADDVYELEG
jgi:hypothetical protein